MQGSATRNFDFRSVPLLRCGPATSEDVGEIVRELGCRHVLLVSDQGVATHGLLEPIRAGLTRLGVDLTQYLDVRSDPTAAMVEAALGVARHAGADGVVGVGGGSSLDVAKLVAWLLGLSRPLAELYGIGRAQGPRCPLVLVPTTAGTGSEMTPVAIVTAADGEKKGVVSPRLVPDAAVLDPDLTLGLPQAVTAATGFDALVHAIESYTSRVHKNPLSDGLSRDAFRLLLGNIHTAFVDGSRRDAREAMLLGAAMAGKAFANAPVGGVHALAYPLGSRLGVAHGVANALMLPAVMRFNLPAARAQYAELACIACPGRSGSDDQLAHALIERLDALRRELGLPTRLREVGASADDVETLAADALHQQRLLFNNPRPIEFGDAVVLYAEVL